ncbi:MAG: hypothetical protein ChlgKO_14450 [Chlamydiales bacterium]
MANTVIPGVKYTELPLQHSYKKAVNALRATFVPSILLGSVSIIGSTKSEEYSWTTELEIIGFGVFLGGVCPLLINKGLTYSTSTLIASLRTKNNDLANYRQIQVFIQSSWSHTAKSEKEEIMKSMTPIQRLYLFANLSKEEQKEINNSLFLGFNQELDNFNTEELTTLPPIDFVRLFVAAGEVSCDEPTMEYFTIQLNYLFDKYQAPENVNLIRELDRTFLKVYELIKGSEAELCISYQYSRHLGITLASLTEDNLQEFQTALDFLSSTLTITQMYSLFEGTNLALQTLLDSKEKASLHDFANSAKKTIIYCKDALFQEMVATCKTQSKEINLNFEEIENNIEMLLILCKDGLIPEDDLRFIETCVKYSQKGLFKEETKDAVEKLYVIMCLLFDNNDNQNLNINKIKESLMSFVFDNKNKKIRLEYLPDFWSAININELEVVFQFFDTKKHFLNYVQSHKEYINQNNPWGEEVPQEIADRLS